MQGPARGDHGSRTLALLAVAIFVEAVGITILGAQALTAYLTGDAGWTQAVALFTLGWLLVVSVLLWRTLHAVGVLHRLASDRDDRLHALVTTSHDWIWQATPEAVFTYSSPGVYDMLGHSPDDVVGRPVFDFVAEEDAGLARQTLAEAVRTGSGWRDVVLRWRHASGHEVTLEGSAVPIADTAGRLIGFRGSRRPVGSDIGAAHAQAAMLQRTQRVLAERSLTIALQPIVDVAGGQLVGAEALARFADGRRPDIAFAEAHDVGLGARLELLALQLALDTGTHLPPATYLSVNASPALLLDPQFPTTLSWSRFPLDRLVIEITEHAVVDRYDEIRAVLLPLRERGLRLAVDDTGAGYASFSHVLRLRPDVIKLDRSLLTHVVQDAAARALITAVVLLALEMGAGVTAEGVETADVLQTVATLGVDSAQGYLLGRPTIEVEAWKSWQGKRWEATQRLVDIRVTSPRVDPRR